MVKVTQKNNHRTYLTLVHRLTTDNANPIILSISLNFSYSSLYLNLQEEHWKLYSFTGSLKINSQPILCQTLQVLQKAGENELRPLEYSD